MRLFTAINFSEHTKNNLMSAIGELKSASRGGNFTQRENLHLTLVFIGEVKSDREISKIKEIIKECTLDNEKFEIEIEKSGRFKRNEGDIVWAGIKKNPQLTGLQKQMSDMLKSFGFYIDEKEYSPHLTLGREVIYSNEEYTKIREILDKTIDSTESVNKISLMKSERIRGVLTYTDIFSSSLNSRKKGSVMHNAD